MKKSPLSDLSFFRFPELTPEILQSIGLLVVLIRLWGGLAEGVMYAILLMNAATPLIDRISQPRAFGRAKTVT